MAQNAPLPPFAAIIVAAGKGLRAGGETPKQFRNWRGKPLLKHSVEALLDHGAREICVAIAESADQLAREALEGLSDFTLVTGGETRQQSVRNALDALAQTNPKHVLIHDAARPDLPREVVERLLGGIEQNSGAIPVLPVVDSLAVSKNGVMAGSADRDTLKRVQTPQAFRFPDILAAHRAWGGEPNAGDDAQVLAAHGGSIALVAGDERLKKITFAEDFMGSTPAAFRVGQGFDVHRLAQGEELWLCGVHIPHDKGLSGHSDADVALHAVVDALLGAIGDGDIGTHFPPSDPQWKGAPSPLFLQHAAKLVGEAGYAISNIDLTIICEAPKIGPHRDAMRVKLAELVGVELSQVSIKATTTERLGFTGRGEGIAAQAMVGLQAH
ncbi:bifunctional 2-C-methyl-D-erythritol 4-phosphate cytidylyltransferase/2-C-methyl-D-erythritol 2,4-cyclodiphosphate synthase [Altererythrobacter lutimaris]|uniref:Bifunctional enzyme IspD/IspF n=1 Tax=Altererythrobacter lutimaris TaxID=2743979 RepID=A0A850HAL2_9SPHN|nr:bifunctional 2-C-methyl-D-erythritol 4-phosphate cytidylyltransferase/2-C-methyl-D-erythritol 2,4-cyclodiphosphate synthase [Altererythrobacter lutimaris]NVE94011.1 bifunctional 2-C-methyl-D-erythritol 4-phosphate cytidylyltransferase/2-C-methyl-D-erythritol 2,4-cyclodiphosphate synthase [Altererythrobacter lutimaris]